jgi:hypothetical protein
MDILQDVRGQNTIHQTNPSNLKDQRKEILLGIDVQTKHIYNLIEMGKKRNKTTLTVNLLKPISFFKKINLF